MAIGSFKDLTRITAACRALYDKTFNIAKNLKYDGYQLASMVYKLLDQKKPSGSSIKNENISDQRLSEELHKPIIRVKESYSHVS